MKVITGALKKQHGISVVGGQFPVYAFECDGIDWEVEFASNLNQWVLLGSSYCDTMTEVAEAVGVFYADLQNGMNEAVANFERNAEINAKRLAIEVVK